MDYEYTEDMGEISGFAKYGDPTGIAYEQRCQAMVIAGAKWFDEHPDAHPKIKSINTGPEIAIVAEADETFEPENQDGKELLDLLFKVGDGPSHLMMTAALSRVFWIHSNGWAAYVDMCREKDGARQAKTVQ